MKRLFALIATLLTIATGARLMLRRFLPRTTGSTRVLGLKQPVEILRDRWGIPHIYAQTEEDLFFAQGYVHAQDRLWQMELQRRAGSGRLSEVLGEPTLEIDRYFRTLGTNRAAEAEDAALDGEEKQILEAYAAGVNAYMAQHKGRLSLEFTLLRFEPEPWRPLDTLYWAKVMAANLGCNWTSELIRARLAAKLGALRAADLEPGYPADNPITVTGSAPPALSSSLPSCWGGSSALQDALRLVEELFQPGGSLPAVVSPSGVVRPGGASNQWVVAGSRTATGRPLLANDTHLAVALPALWYQVHLVGGRYNVTGVSFPGTPGVVVGHNEHCAWGLTTGWQDAQDLYVERPNPDNPHQFAYQGQWLDAHVVQEEIQVKGRSQPVLQEVVITRHGPIISQVVGEATPLALRWVALEESHLLRGVLAYGRARNWQEFRQALADWSTPAHNFVYADVAGNIGFLQAGWVPVRSKGQGMAPVPGWTGEYEWERYLTVDELPQAFNPEQGWIAVANNLVTDESYPFFLSSDLENPCRAARAAELIAGTPKVTIADCIRFQRDTYSDQARRFVRHLLPVQPQNRREHQALALLKEWDFHMEPDSVAASLYTVCRLRALHIVFDEHLGELAGTYIGFKGVAPVDEVSPFYFRSFVRLLDLLDGDGQDEWLKDPHTGIPRLRQEIMHQALRQALKLLRQAYGDDMDQWTWGRLNQVHFNHPVGSVKPLHLLFNKGPYPTGGDLDTMLRAAGKPVFPLEPVSTVDALRFVADVGDWEQSCMMIAGGQSGHVSSPHYADLIPLWHAGELLPMPFTRTSVERQAVERLLLQ